MTYREDTFIQVIHDRICSSTTCALRHQLVRIWWQEKSGVEERRRVRRAANQRFLGAMLDMGIPQDHAELALAETGNVGVEVRQFHIPSKFAGFAVILAGNIGERQRHRQFYTSKHTNAGPAGDV